MIKEEILELIEQCEGEIKNKDKFNDIESTTVKYARKIDQKLMQYMINVLLSTLFGYIISLLLGFNVTKVVQSPSSTV